MSGFMDILSDYLMNQPAEKYSSAAEKPVSAPEPNHLMTQETPELRQAQPTPEEGNQQMQPNMMPQQVGPTAGVNGPGPSGGMSGQPLPPQSQPMQSPGLVAQLRAQQQMNIQAKIQQALQQRFGGR
jgi:hypothetical protein